MVQINTDSFAQRVEELKQEEAARKANLPSNFAKMIKPQPGSTVFFTTVVLDDEQANDLENVTFGRDAMFREVEEANLYDEPKWTDRVMTPAIVGKSDEQYGYKEWTLSEGEMVYFQLPATVRIQLYNHVQDDDMDYEPLLVTQDGIVLNADSATAFKLHRDDSGAITSYSTLILTAKASSKYIPETVSVAPEAFDEYIDGYKKWQQSRFDKATGNTQNDSENTPDSL